ncbi:hypothetical protein KZX29_04420 [Moraxella osloensis]|uniref:hypothetical protein n=1 Tax=Faucicola osloensis TaxID=34062 RepID=UPI0020068053|nr:hypothetical protein [Moraxella osloensis]MCK6158042.1 hypothetical protein [Moraxella osloensis]
MKERIFTAHELKVWNEHFSKYDISKIIRLKRQYLSANRHGLPKTSEELEAVRVWNYYKTILRTGELPKAKLSVREQIENILENQGYFELSQIDAKRNTVIKITHDFNRNSKGEKLQAYYQNGSTERKVGSNDRIFGYRLVRVTDTAEQAESKPIERNKRLSSDSQVKSALYNKVYEHFSSVRKSVLNANDLAAFNNQSVVIRVIEDLGYRFSPNAANWHLRASA